MNRLSNGNQPLSQFPESFICSKYKFKKNNEEHQLTSIQDIHNASQQKIFALLSNREAEVLFYLLKGNTAKETADVLFISSRTVERHWENIKAKFDCRNKFELVNKILNLILEGMQITRL